jgi:hypothetical protein
MRYLLVALFGLLIGAAAAGAVLYYNPVTETSAAAAGPADRLLRYSLPDQVLEFSLGAAAGLLGQSTGDDSLWEDTIDRTAVLGLVLNDDKNLPAAVASRLMAASADTDFLLHGVLVSDYWLVTIPGEGSLFVRAESNVWPFLKQTLVPVWYLDQPWQGPVEYRPTVGPGAANTAKVLGISGAFIGQDGSAVERYKVTALDPASHTAAAVGELYLRLPGPQVAAQN